MATDWKCNRFDFGEIFLIRRAESENRADWGLTQLIGQKWPINLEVLLVTALARSRRLATAWRQNR